MAVTYEEHPWEQDADEPAILTRRQRMNARGHYRAAVTPEIADLPVNVPADVAAASEDALVEITRFDAELTSGLPGLADCEGEIAPLASVLLRTESASSSQIENVTAGAKSLALATLHERTGPNAELVAANVTAMLRAIDMSDQLSLDSILAAHGALMSGHEYAQPGRIRDGQVWIGGRAPTPHTAEFVPPHHSRVATAMRDLIAFTDRTDIPVLTHAAVAHAQFETIHPFADGNGRIGRVLVHAMLRRSGATRRMTVPVSAGLLTDVRAYFDALTAYREGDPAPIVEQFALASLTAVGNGRRLAADLRDIHDRWETTLRARRDAAARRMLPHLVRQPAVTLRYVQESVEVSQPAAQRAIDQLVEAGALAPASQNRRNRVWVAPEVIEALDDFAARTGRRS